MKELLFSVTAADCRFDYMRGTGPGGQKRNKTESKVRCTHIASGAVGESDETRNQGQNKQRAFLKMAESKTFKDWHRLEIAKRLGQLNDIEERIDESMNEKNLRVEVKSPEGRWVEEIDMLNQSHLGCNGKFVEGSLQDSWQGLLTCNSCGDTMKRYYSKDRK